MSKRIAVVIIAALLLVPFVFGQMKYSRSRSQSPTPTPTPPQQVIPPQTPPRTAPTLPPRNVAIPPKQSPTSFQKTTQVGTQPKPAPATQIQPKQMATPAPTPAKPTPTPVPPPDVKAYLDKQIATSKDKKFHMTVNGQDLALTPFHVWMQKSSGPNTTSTIISMRSDEGRVYDIEFTTAGAQITTIGIRRINGESVR